MTEPRNGRPSAALACSPANVVQDPGPCRVFLAVVARVPTDGTIEDSEHLLELLASARHLLLFPPFTGWEPRDDFAGYRSALDAAAALTLLPEGPGGASMSDEPERWLDLALGSPACRSDTIGLETTVMVTEALQVLAPGPLGSQELHVICDLARERFAPAWRRHLEEAAPAANLSRVADVVCEVPPGKPSTAGGERHSDGTLAARLVELEYQVRELCHEREVLRTNRDNAREEYLRELQEHRELNERNRVQLEASHRELEVRATINAELREEVESFEGLLHRKWAVRVAKWLGRLESLRRRLFGGGS